MPLKKNKGRSTLQRALASAGMTAADGAQKALLLSLFGGFDEEEDQEPELAPPLPDAVNLGDLIGGGGQDPGFQPAPVVDQVQPGQVQMRKLMEILAGLGLGG